jgi:hypothetical protein
MDLYDQVIGGRGKLPIARRHLEPADLQLVRRRPFDDNGI